MKTFEINRILVPIDFSEVSLNALGTAIAISKRQLATLTLIHIIENGYTLYPPEAGAFAGSVLPELVDGANEYLNDLAKKIRLEHDVVVNHIVLSGNAADEICRWGFHKEIDLIVMGTHGASGFREFFLGSNAYRVVKNAPCPAMTIPGTNQWIDFKKILFPIRMVPHALDKYEVVRPIIRKNGSSLLIAGVIQKNDPAGLTEMKALVDAVRKNIAEDEVKCESDIYNCENVSRQVLDIANIEKPDLIVITATLDTSLRDFFLGPYTQDIVNHSQYPVLSIRPAFRIKSLSSLSDLTLHSTEHPIPLL
ncbi:MAG TPA: universal stress protein [Chryseolinea sp.]|nr:universal stress protein [Chryseolinea sp.]